MLKQDPWAAPNLSGCLVFAALAQDPWMEPGISGCLVLAQDPWAELSISVYLPKDPFAELSINGRFVLVREPWAQQRISGCFPSRLLGRNKHQSVLWCCSGSSGRTKQWCDRTQHPYVFRPVCTSYFLGVSEPNQATVACFIVFRPAFYVLRTLFFVL